MLEALSSFSWFRTAQKFDFKLEQNTDRSLSSNLESLLTYVWRACYSFPCALCAREAYCPREFGLNTTCYSLLVSDHLSGCTSGLGGDGARATCTELEIKSLCFSDVQVRLQCCEPALSGLVRIVTPHPPMTSGSEVPPANTPLSTINMSSPLPLQDWNQAFMLSTPVRPTSRHTPSKTNWKLGTAQVRVRLNQSQ